VNHQRNNSSTAGEEDKHLTLKVGRSTRRRRLDKYLHGRFGDLSRAAIQKQINAGEVTVNGRRVKPGFLLSSGDEVTLKPPKTEPDTVVAEQIPLEVIHEDDCVIVLNKQAGILVHPARSHTHGTLVNALAWHCEKIRRQLDTDRIRPGIVHRLDKNTTGVMVVAKTPEAQWKIARQFENRTVEKAYLAIVHGTPELSADRIKAPLGMHPRIREKFAILGQSTSAKEAVTFYEVLEGFRGFSLLKLSPKTGRTHQIRVHLSYIKHPVVADDMYGGKPVYRWQLADEEPAIEEPIIGRSALHASTIKFIHPATRQHVTFEAPLPEDMKRVLEALRKHRSKL
jgi:23S rRNA pseudouridine1911/1915/1917 synthase